MPKTFYTAMLALLIAVPATTVNRASAQIYTQSELEPEKVRLRNAVIKIYEIGLKPSLTDEEKNALGDFEFNFPMPRQGDDLLNFAATTDGRYLIMPLMSLKALEDLATAYAWLYHNNYSLSTIDLYFAMLRYRDPKNFPGSKAPKILDALSVPEDAYKTSKKVDELSLSIRNEAYAFIIAHELGHIRFRHKPVQDISARQAQADETESDSFALDLFRRTDTAPLGPILFFQAQVYGSLNRYEFSSEDAWIKHLTKVSTHPLTLDRLKSLNAYIRDAVLPSRKGETKIWLFAAEKFGEMFRIMQDEHIARCITILAKEASLSILKPRADAEDLQQVSRCYGRLDR